MQETRETRVPPLGWEDPLEEEMSTYFLLRSSMDKGARRAIVLAVFKETGLSNRAPIHAFHLSHLPLFLPSAHPQKKNEIENMRNVMALCVSHDEITQCIVSCFAGIHEL